MGGAYDPKTKQVVWAFRAPIDEQRAHYGAHPPSLFGALRATPIELPTFSFDGHGEPVNAIFEVACPCGGRLFAATGWVDDDDDIGPPITLVCQACEAYHDVFDPAGHGYDALAAPSAPPDPGDRPDEFPDPEPPYEVILRFEYASDMLGDDAWRGREQDAFSWITILARKPGQAPTVLFDWECD